MKSSKELKRVTVVGFRVKKGQTRIRYMKLMFDILPRSVVY